MTVNYDLSQLTTSGVGVGVTVVAPSVSGQIFVVVIHTRGTGSDLLTFGKPLGFEGDWTMHAVAGPSGSDMAHIAWAPSSGAAGYMTFPVTSGVAGATTEVKVNSLGINENPILPVTYLDSFASSDVGSMDLTSTTWPAPVSDPLLVIAAGVTWADQAPHNGLSGDSLSDGTIIYTNSYPTIGFRVGVDTTNFPDGPSYGAWTVHMNDAGILLVLRAASEFRPLPPPPPHANFTCPKSIRACALRITKLNGSGVPLDPLAFHSRVQTSAFIELALSPDMESGTEVVVKANKGESIAIIDRSCSTLKGLQLNFKLCGVPHPVLDLLLGVTELMDTGYQVGGALRDDGSADCVAPVMIELWSRNVGDTSDGRWIHWLLPKTFRWVLAGSLTFTDGPLDIELSGYGEKNQWWFPSLPGPANRGYQPGGGDLNGWPTGAFGTSMLPAGVSADPWLPADIEAIRAAGPLAWRVVKSLPSPLDECDYLPGFCEEDLTFCGPEGADASTPWSSPFLPTEV